jgi:hypothetical protein
MRHAAPCFEDHHRVAVDLSAPERPPGDLLRFRAIQGGHKRLHLDVHRALHHDRARG